MSKLTPSLAPIVARMEALVERARCPDLRPGDLDEPLIAEANEIRALLIEALAQETAAAQAAAFSPSGVSALRPGQDASPGPAAAPGPVARRPDRL
jgi:hypothetical protein